MLIKKIKFKTFIPLGTLLCLGLALYVGISFATGTAITLTSPDGTSYNLGDSMTFSGNVDTGGVAATSASLVVKDADGNYQTQQTRSDLFLSGTGSPFSLIYLDQYNPNSGNPTIITDQDGDTCSGSNSPCNLLGNTVTSPGTYWHPILSGRTSIYAVINLKDVSEVSSFNVVQHDSYYARHLKLEFSTDNIGWYSPYEANIVATQSITLPSPVVAKYVKMTYSNFFNAANFYVSYIDLTGKLTTPKSSYVGPISFATTNNFNGGVNNWNICVTQNSVCTYASSDKQFTSNATSIDFSSTTPPNNASQGHSVIGSVVTSSEIVECRK